MTSAHYLRSYEGKRAKKTNFSLGHPGLTQPIQPLCLTPSSIWGFIYLFCLFILINTCIPPNTLMLLSGWYWLKYSIPFSQLRMVSDYVTCFSANAGFNRFSLKGKILLYSWCSSKEDWISWCTWQTLIYFLRLKQFHIEKWPAQILHLQILNWELKFQAEVSWFAAWRSKLTSPLLIPWSIFLNHFTYCSLLYAADSTWRKGKQQVRNLQNTNV